MPKAIRKLPPVDYLRQCFDYEPDTGVLLWRERPLTHFKSLHARNAWNAKHIGKVVGAFFGNGYSYTQLNRRKFLISRIIWKMNHGTEPLLIDHADRNPANNRIENLRNVTYLQSGQNRLKPVGGSGLTGVHLLPTGRYRAQIKDGPKMRHIGVFATAEEAHAAYRSAAASAFGEFDPFRLQNSAQVEDESSS